MRKKLLVVSLVLAVVLQACIKKKEEKITVQTTTETKTFDSIQPIERPVKDLQYSIQVETIDSVKFHTEQMKSGQQKDQFKKIESFAEARKLLKGVVEFSDQDEYGDGQAVRKINFRNGKVLQNRNDFDGEFFIAYFPDEDILLCEGGHTSDMSFNLKNGGRTEETGNPDVIVSSPGKEFRLNGYFGGQECYFYFIQRKIGHEYVKVIQLDEEFEKQTGIWLCIMGPSFWADHTTFYLTEESNYTDNGLKKRYFKVKITER